MSLALAFQVNAMLLLFHVLELIAQASDTSLDSSEAADFHVNAEGL